MKKEYKKILLKHKQKAEVINIDISKVRLFHDIVAVNG